MNFVELLKEATQWFLWLGLGLALMTLISFFVGWGIRYRLVGATVFSLLLSASTWAFTASYRPPVLKSGAVYAPIVFDNGYDLVIAQASADFSQKALQPTLEQIAANLKGVGRSESMVHVRIRKLEPNGNGTTTPTVLGEVVRDMKNGVTLTLAEFNADETLSNLNSQDPLAEFNDDEALSNLNNQDPLTKLDNGKSNHKLNNRWNFKSR